MGIGNWIKEKLEHKIPILGYIYAFKDIKEKDLGPLELADELLSPTGVGGVFFLILEMLGIVSLSDEDKEDGETELEDPEFDRTSGQSRRGRPMTDGGQPVNSNRNRNRGRRNTGSGKASKITGIFGAFFSKLFGLLTSKLLLIPVILIIGTVIVFGVLGATGSGYGGLLSDMFGGYTSGIGSAVDGAVGGISYKVQKFTALATCFGDAGCVREWKLNSTEQPGSEDVGETYRLQVDGPTVKGSNDVRFMEKDAPIPITFRVKNTRHGIKGINAEGVKYRFLVRDPQLFSQGEAMCNTSWLPLNKYGEDPPEAFKGKNNLILPGEEVTPLNYAGEDRLTLKECGLMNPVSTSVEAVLQIKYNYSAKSFLNLDVMASDNKPGETEMDRSKTPDTPVETSIHAPNPVRFDIRETQRTPRPFKVELQISTDQRNIDFNMSPEDFSFTDSDYTDWRGKDNCRGLSNDTGKENVFRFSENAEDRIRNRQKNAEWFSKRTPTPQVFCGFTIEEEDLSKISPTGETITMTASANYTVRQNEKSESFSMKNTMCRDINCPVLKPLTASDLSKVIDVDLDHENPIKMENPEHYRTKEYAYCNRPQDSRRGCSIVEDFSVNKRNDPIRKDKDKGKGEPYTISEDTFALKLEDGFDDDSGKRKNMISEYVEEQLKKDNEKPTNPTYLSIPGDFLENAYKNNNQVLNYSKSFNEWQLVDLSEEDSDPMR